MLCKRVNHAEVVDEVTKVADADAMTNLKADGDTMLMTSLHMMTLQGAEGTAVGEADDLVAALVRIAPWKLWTKSWTISVVHVTTNTNGNFHQVEDPIRTQIAAMTRAESKPKVVAG